MGGERGSMFEESEERGRSMLEDWEERGRKDEREEWVRGILRGIRQGVFRI